MIVTVLQPHPQQLQGRDHANPLVQQHPEGERRVRVQVLEHVSDGHRARADVHADGVLGQDEVLRRHGPVVRAPARRERVQDESTAELLLDGAAGVDHDVEDADGGRRCDGRGGAEAEDALLGDHQWLAAQLGAHQLDVDVDDRAGAADALLRLLEGPERDAGRPPGGEPLPHHDLHHRDEERRVVAARGGRPVRCVHQPARQPLPHAGPLRRAGLTRRPGKLRGCRRHQHRLATTAPPQQKVEQEQIVVARSAPGLREVTEVPLQGVCDGEAQTNPFRQAQLLAASLLGAVLRGLGLLTLLHFVLLSRSVGFLLFLFHPWQLFGRALGWQFTRGFRTG